MDEVARGTGKETGGDQLTRRTFLDLFFAGGILITVAAVVWAVVRFLLPHESPFTKGGKVPVGELDQIPVGGSVRRAVGGRGVLVVRTRTGFAGLSLNCTHKGCNVEWDPDRKVVVCPCHGGTYDLQGNVLDGPPPRPLKRYKISVLGEKVYIEG